LNLPAVVVIASLMLAAAGNASRPSELSGRVVFSDAGVPGVTVSAARRLDPDPRASDRIVTTLTDEEGVFRLADLEDGTWTLHVEMRGFVAINRDVAVPFTESPLVFALKMRPYEEIVGGGAAGIASTGASSSRAAPPVTAPPDEPDIINGSLTNAAATPFAQPRAIGNNRPRLGRLYTGGLASNLANSALNARPYSFGGSTVPADTSNIQLGFNLGGPFRIPWLIEHGPMMSFSFNYGVNSDATTQSTFMPTPAERAGDFSQSATIIRDPLTDLPFADNTIPLDRISPQAMALLAYYPLPNTTTTKGANFWRAIVTETRQGSARFQTSYALTPRDRIQGDVSGRRFVTESVNLFDFTDTQRQSSFDAKLSWTHTFSPRLQMAGRYLFTRSAATLTPFFANRIDVSADAGITGNDPRPGNWGPPTIAFPTIADLEDGEYKRTVTSMHALGASIMWRLGGHNMTFGGDVNRTAFDQAAQPDARGTLSFTGAATGNAIADFLLGIPTTSSMAFGTTHTVLRGATFDAYFTDDFRMAPGLTLNAGVRWEYESPFTEREGRLVNFDVAPGFAAVSPVLAGDPIGSLTGHRYPASLLRADRRGIEPRIAASWRPRLTSSLVIRAGYGLYRNLGTYQSLALLLAQQPPFAKTFSIQNTPATPLTLANPFPVSLPANSNTFAIDPDYRAGFSHSWQVTVQSDLPASMTVIAGWFASRGTHLMQAFLPNTYPAGAANPCPACPAGFVYITSNGTSLRNAGQLTVRRRLRNGFTAGAQYTLAKATDDAATFNNRRIEPGSLAIAQDWLNLAAERGPSPSDQRHLVSIQFQYGTGRSLTGGMLVDTKMGRIFNGWTVDGQLHAGSGLPFTPVAFLAVNGTGVVGVRPRLTGELPAPPTAGSYANAAAYAAPLPATWGDAGRNSIRGPSQFTFDMSVARTFLLPRRMRIDWRINLTNVLNRVTFSAINTVITSPQFGMPTRANAMRRIQMSLAFGF
jgi:hypothetical protein